MTAAIKTKYFSPTNHRKPRIKAESMEARMNGSRPSLIHNWDNAQNAEENHRTAARMYIKNCTLLDINNINMHSGSCDGGWVFVLVRK